MLVLIEINMKTKIETDEKAKEAAKQLANILIVFNTFYKTKLKEKHAKQK